MMMVARSGKRYPGRSVVVVLAAATLLPWSASAQRAPIVDRLPVEVVASIVWQGKELELRKVIACDQRKRMHPGTEGDRGFRLREVWEQSVIRVAHLLPSGEVLIFELPHICKEFDRRTAPLAQNFIPLTTWVDSADAPKAAERIMSYRYFEENTKRRLELRRFRMAAKDDAAAEIDDDQRLTWLLRSAGKPDAYFAGVFVAAIPKTVWGQFTALATELQNRRSGLVDRQLVERHARLLLSSCESSADGVGPAPKCIFGQFDDRSFISSAARVSEQSWKLDLNDVGVRRYLHLIDISQLDSTGCDRSFPGCNLFKGTYQLIVNGTGYDIKKAAGDLIFDADKQLLIRPQYQVERGTYINPNRAGQ